MHQRNMNVALKKNSATSVSGGEPRTKQIKKGENRRNHAISGQNMQPSSKILQDLALSGVLPVTACENTTDSHQTFKNEQCILLPGNIRYTVYYTDRKRRIL